MLIVYKKRQRAPCRASAVNNLHDGRKSNNSGNGGDDDGKEDVIVSRILLYPPIKENMLK